MHNNKRRQNGMNGGQHRHHNNRPRRFNNGGGRSQNGGNMDDPANVARTRRNAIQQREKYQMMARDALAIGDRVLAENHLQYADHYHRVLLALPPEEIRQPYQPREHQAGINNGADRASSLGQENIPLDNDPMPSVSLGLPQFITQPMTSERPEEQN